MLKNFAIENFSLSAIFKKILEIPLQMSKLPYVISEFLNFRNSQNLSWLVLYMLRK